MPWIRVSTDPTPIPMASLELGAIFVAEGHPADRTYRKVRNEGMWSAEVLFCQEQKHKMATDNGEYTYCVGPGCITHRVLVIWEP